MHHLLKHVDIAASLTILIESLEVVRIHLQSCLIADSRTYLLILTY